ncbi:hypothetical protein EKO27_g5396 [Xylaria grammica]|uniref:Uncharacterized protein n=1 Tax=Xylaria grammica TaxID=363999 RepID=A0A439D5N6_9PEZI|nr:hypothetical protein EKO27_g5396 [Xylaria grammica]
MVLAQAMKDFILVHRQVPLLARRTIKAIIQDNTTSIQLLAQGEAYRGVFLMAHHSPLPMAVHIQLLPIDMMSNLLVYFKALPILPLIELLIKHTSSIIHLPLARSERRFPDQPAGVPSPVNSTPPALSAKASPFLEGSRPQQQDRSDTVLVNLKGMEKYTTEEFSWEEEMIFKELPDKTTRDLIREPLPAEWTDDPIMPPKYDKETITSRYINPTNVDDFALNVRETKAWQVMQYHPAFLPPTEIRIEKLWEYEKALNRPACIINKADIILPAAVAVDNVGNHGIQERERSAKRDICGTVGKAIQAMINSATSG